MFGISWIDLVILVLASFRLTHLIVYDEITSFLRKPFFTVVYEADASGQMNRQYRFKGGKVRRWIGELLSCHWCMGMWVAVLTVAVYAYVPAAYPILLLLAIAGAAAVIETRLYM
ncbi:DUF1360 domain-containing protein [Brevibacillus agri]|uniref:DUF1360 domain-containing protein n=1 Tax=Brevibacillus TaxID=55080 RepID=UPI000271CC71|nr:MULTISPECIES: DUF1360 domain-containing protein [Brevibacillus]ELK40399.1 hypothetical protein D478_19364 [Brevibacillus agri BAB-2500]EJL43051.1 Protein of unknown function (DUF1360) [Brevibacillus sp. CF112]MBG9564156.1 sporulation protein [Brevibacillus agri]MBY0053486.1 DUF1360 domain-containing protein [Brevibacillus agri]MCG5251747.1 DUF1360 domain-containing protein [Brevibacillus agri]